MIDYEEKIERGLILWLREEHGITAVSASIGESEVEDGWGGCDTCGYGGSDPKVETPVWYKTDESHYGETVYVDGTSINFLPTLLGYIDRAN